MTDPGPRDILQSEEEPLTTGQKYESGTESQAPQVWIRNAADFPWPTLNREGFASEAREVTTDC